MERIIRVIINSAWLSFLLGACNPNDYLDKIPKDQLIADQVFNDNETIKAYVWQFYEVFPGYAQGRLNAEFDGDLFDRVALNPSGESNWAYGRMVVPANSASYSGPFKNIRTINILLDNLRSSDLSESDKNHWRSVGLFFRAYNYFELVSKYGDVPWIDRAITDEDTDILFAPRTPRIKVAQHILDDLLYAESNIRPGGDGPNTVNAHVVRALISRFALFEGTWRRYHNLESAEIFLKASKGASGQLIVDFPELHTNYDEVFNSESLAGVPGILLYKAYYTGQIHHDLTHFRRSHGGRGFWDLTKKAADMYLLEDGQTRWISPLFDGEQSPYDEFRHRDRRFYYTVQPPFRVVPAGSQSESWEYTDNPADREYIDLMATITDAAHKIHPTANWQGFVVKEMPHFNDNNMGQAFYTTNTGYSFYKYYNNLSNGVREMDISDAPIFRMGEVLVNHAEALYELGEFDQSVADETVNKLRARGHIASLDLSNVPSDPTRDADVSPILWEIRRERAIELMGEGFRFDDLRRWKKMAYLGQRKLGRWIERTPQNRRIPILNDADEGYIAYRSEPVTPPDYYYLYPVPSDQIVITNGIVTQNPGWE